MGAMLGIGPEQAVAARHFGAVIAMAATVNLGAQQGGGMAAPAAGQARLSGHQSPARGSAAGAGGADSAHQPEGQPPDADHAGGVVVGPHVGFQQGTAIGRTGGGPADGLLQSLGAMQPAHDPGRGAGVRVAAVGAHDHRVGRKTNALQPGAGISASRDHGVAEVGACALEPLADH